MIFGIQGLKRSLQTIPNFLPVGKGWDFYYLSFLNMRYCFPFSYKMWLRPTSWVPSCTCWNLFPILFCVPEYQLASTGLPHMLRLTTRTLHMLSLCLACTFLLSSTSLLWIFFRIPLKRNSMTLETSTQNLKKLPSITSMSFSVFVLHDDWRYFQNVKCRRNFTSQGGLSP